MRNEQLIEAREQRGWTQAVAAEKSGVSRVAYARWEEQGVIPRLWAINKARDAFKMTAEQLGFKKYPSTIPTGGLRTPASTLPSAGTARSETTPALVAVGIAALSLAQRLYGYPLEELL